jgi:hypothetical protein
MVVKSFRNLLLKQACALSLALVSARTISLPLSIYYLLRYSRVVSEDPTIQKCLMLHEPICIWFLADCLIFWNVTVLCRFILKKVCITSSKGSKGIPANSECKIKYFYLIRPCLFLLTFVGKCSLTSIITRLFTR